MLNDIKIQIYTTLNKIFKNSIMNKLWFNAWHFRDHNCLQNCSLIH